MAMMTNEPQAATQPGLGLPMQGQQQPPKLTAKDLGLREIEQRTPQQPQPITDIATTATEPALVAHVAAAWQRNKLAKEPIDRKLLRCLRARRGIYGPDELALMQQNGGVNVVWYDLTETKCRGASAWIRDVVLPTSGERPWGLDPTTLAELPKQFKLSLVHKAIKEAQDVMIKAAKAGGGTMPSDEFRQTVRDIGDKLREDAEKRIKEEAAKRAGLMEDTIADRMDQGGWTDAMDAFVEEFVTFPAATLKGPIYQQHKRLQWREDWTPEVVTTPEQSWVTVSAFDAYPAPGASSPQQGDFIERMRFWRSELHALKGLEGYRDDQIDMALREYHAGHLEGWLWTDAERMRLQSESLYMYLSPPGMIDALNYYGSAPGWMLKSWGVEGADDVDLTREYEINIVKVGRFLIYAALNPHPLGGRPYRSASYDAIPGAYWGRSIPELCETAQRFANVAACAMADNMSMSSGPMVWVHVDRLADGEQSMEVIPWKVWQLKDAGMGTGTNPGIGFFQATDTTQPMMAALNFWESKADDASGVPRYTYGSNESQGGAAGTATGLSMLLNAAAKGLRRGIASIDRGVIAPTVGDTFVNEMLYNPDESIKGDCVVVPRGASAILIKDVAQQRRLQFLGMTANPIDMAIIGNKGRAALLRETAKAMDLPVDDILPTQSDMDDAAQAQAEAAKQQAQEGMQMQLAQHAQETAIDAQAEQAKIEAQGKQKQREQFTGVLSEMLRSQMSSQPADLRGRAAAEGALPMRGLSPGTALPA